MIRKEKYHIIHTHTSKAGFIGRLAAKLGGTRYIVHGVHTIPFADILQPQYNRFFLDLERFVARFTDVFISVGEDLRARYVDAGVGKPEKYQVVYSGMDIEQFNKALLMSKYERDAIRREIGVSDDEICVGIVSRLENGKGFNVFSSIVSQVVSRVSSVKFVVVGDGSLRDQLVNEINEKNLDQNVKFIGFRDDIAMVMATFDLAIFTSFLEGLPRAVVQYAMLGKPIVTFDAGGVREVVKDGSNGFIIKMNDVEDFSAKIIYLLEYPDVMKKMRMSNNEFPGHQWSKDEMVRRIDSIYDELLKN